MCGSDVTISNFLVNKLSPDALIAANYTYLDVPDVLIQELRNPFGIQFSVVTLKHAHCAHTDSAVSIEWHIRNNNGGNWHSCMYIFQWTHSSTWFPGYAWKVCYCAKCSSHLGWMFEPIETAAATLKKPTSAGFYAIIIKNVLGETCMCFIYLLRAILSNLTCHFSLLFASATDVNSLIISLTGHWNLIYLKRLAEILTKFNQITANTSISLP